MIIALGKMSAPAGDEQTFVVFAACAARQAGVLLQRSFPTQIGNRLSCGNQRATSSYQGSANSLTRGVAKRSRHHSAANRNNRIFGIFKLLFFLLFLWRWYRSVADGFARRALTFIKTVRYRGTAWRTAGLIGHSLGIGHSRF